MGLTGMGWLAGGGGAAVMLLLLGSCLSGDDTARVAASAPAAATATSPAVVAVAGTMAAGAAAAATPAPTPAATPAFRFDDGPDARRQQGGVLRGRVPDGTAALTLDGAPVAVADDGRFVIAFDRDAPAAMELVAVLASGERLRETLALTPGNWRIQHIDAPMRGAARSDAEFARRRPAELAQINAARRTAVTSDGWRQRFVWPVTGRVSGVFGSQRVYRGQPGSYHSGVDVARPTGTPFVAPADGVVTLAAVQPFTLEGRLLIVGHGMGLSSAFLHCDRLDVAVGDRVVQGQRLGTIGATGRVTGPHLHWGMRWHRARIDPVTLTGPMPTTGA